MNNPIVWPTCTEFISHKFSFKQNSSKQFKTNSNTQFVAWLWIRIDWTSTKNWWSYSSYRSFIKPLFSAKIEPGALHPPLFSWRHNPPRPTSRLLFLPFADSKAAVMFWVCCLLFCCCWFAIDFPIRIDDDESMDWEDGPLWGQQKLAHTNTMSNERRRLSVLKGDVTWATVRFAFSVHPWYIHVLQVDERKTSDRLKSRAFNF